MLTKLGLFIMKYLYMCMFVCVEIKVFKTAETLAANIIEIRKKFKQMLTQIKK